MSSPPRCGGWGPVHPAVRPQDPVLLPPLPVPDGRPGRFSSPHPPAPSRARPLAARRRTSPSKSTSRRVGTGEGSYTCQGRDCSWDICCDRWRRGSFRLFPPVRPINRQGGPRRSFLQRSATAGLRDAHLPIPRCGFARTGDRIPLSRSLSGSAKRALFPGASPLA